jgi:hypothetical protein
VASNHQHQVMQTLASFGQVTGADLVLVLRTMVLKRNKLDILPHWLFKATSQVLLPLIVCFVNCVLKTGLPRVYKHAIITPLSKSASLDANELKNYRPVSNFPTMVKIIENVIAKKIVHHLESNSLMDPNQSAYRKLLNIIRAKQLCYRFLMISTEPLIEKKFL